ncbi:acyltransferase [Kluyvera intermedia]|jgi:surface polysaccharide O-acyltransferase-like enzyme|uniref:acyltransferase n=1 Tax=Kluyvera intermedia TaxID=61648 RepID=UPI00242A89DA|nr:acyltransferase family protein [Kluyvera intermedia]WEJ86421.1 MAG: acyltransferase family protein [Kluyvera intermedia]
MRNNALDAVKLLACFFIIVVHVGNFSEMPQHFGEFFRVSSRWALPFFFLASGYLMGSSAYDDLGKKLNKLISILFWSSILYIPVLYQKMQGDVWRVIRKIISNDTLHEGTFFHLWFLNALILGVVLTNYFVKNVGVKSSLIISMVILVACWYGDVVKSLHDDINIFYPLRTLIAFSLVYLGYYFSKSGVLKIVPNYAAICVILFGIIFMMAESYILGVTFNANITERQFPLFATPVCIALLSLCVNNKIKDNVFSAIGKDYALGVYILHPLVLYILMHEIGGCIANNSMLKLVISFSSSILILMIIKAVIPIAYRKLNGIGVK